MSDAPRPSPARILLADDDPAVLPILAMALKSGGHAVTRAADGTAALEALEKERFDLLVLDILMPGATGWEVVQRAHDLTPKGDPLPRAILFTGFQQEFVVDLDLLQREGVSGILLKPFPATDLLAEVGRVLALEPLLTLPRPAGRDAARS